MYRIQFPPIKDLQLAQNEAYFYLVEKGERKKIKFHNYDTIYDHPKLYEQLFYDRLKCASPRKVKELLEQSLQAVNEECSRLRVLDLGAGNGIMGEELKEMGVARIVGFDILEEAREAAYRDRPTVYDEYIVGDILNLKTDQKEMLKEWGFDCFTCVAALGFGDIPPAAFFEALKLIPVGGWVAFNIKETFLNHSDKSGFSQFIRELIFSEYLEVYHIEKYQHRLSIYGEPLRYFALVARIRSEVPDNFVDKAVDA